MGKHSRRISLFFLAVLVLIKVSALHTYSHQETDTAYDSCTWCHLALETQHEEYLYAEIAPLPEAALEALARIIPATPAPVAAFEVYQDGRYCRPPPAIL